MSTYRTLAEPHLEKVFKILDETCIECGINHFLIGAQARDIQMLENGIKPARITLDIDFAVMVPDMGTFDELKQKLSEKGFRQDKMPYRMIFDESNTIIDLMPCGEVEQEGNTVNFDKRQLELSVIGLKEVSESTKEYKLETVTIKVTPLEGLFILKLISNHEKPERVKDLDDIKDIIINYFDIHEDRIYEELWDVIEEVDVDNFTLFGGAKILGKDVAQILKLSDELHKLISEIIERELTEQTGSITSYYAQKKYFKSHELTKQIFTHIKDGIQGN